MIVTRNWGVKIGEIDLIALTPLNELVFVEVKTVTNPLRGDASYRVSKKKLQTITKVAQIYLDRHKINESARIDVVAITMGQIEHFEGVFFVS